MIKRIQKLHLFEKGMRKLHSWKIDGHARMGGAESDSDTLFSFICLLIWTILPACLHSAVQEIIYSKVFKQFTNNQKPTQNLPSFTWGSILANHIYLCWTCSCFVAHFIIALKTYARTALETSSLPQLLYARHESTPWNSHFAQSLTCEIQFIIIRQLEWHLPCPRESCLKIWRGAIIPVSSGGPFRSLQGVNVAYLSSHFQRWNTPGNEIR